MTKSKSLLPATFFFLTFLFAFRNDIQSQNFDEIKYIGQNFYKVKKEDKWGVAFNKNKLIIPLEYDDVEYGNNYTFRAKKGEKWGFVNLKNQVIVPFELEVCDMFRKGTSKAKKNGKWGWVNMEGNTVIDFEYDFIDPKNISSKLIGAMKNDKWAIHSFDGRKICEAIYNDTGYTSQTSYNDNRIYVTKDGKWGYIDTFGIEVTPLEYERARWFNEGLGAVMKGGKYGFIDKENNLVIPHIYEDVGMFFRGGLCKVKKEGKFGLINKNNETVVEFEYDDIEMEYDWSDEKNIQPKSATLKKGSEKTKITF